jgi:hypothetical protein
MPRLVVFVLVSLALAGCVYYPYGYAPRYSYQPPSYGYAYGPPAYAPVPGYPYAPPPYGPSAYPQTLGPQGNTPGAVAGD